MTSVMDCFQHGEVRVEILIFRLTAPSSREVSDLVRALIQTFRDGVGLQLTTIIVIAYPPLQRR